MWGAKGGRGEIGGGDNSEGLGSGGPRGLECSRGSWGSKPADPEPQHCSWPKREGWKCVLLCVCMLHLYSDRVVIDGKMRNWKIEDYLDFLKYFKIINNENLN